MLQAFIQRKIDIHSFKWNEDSLTSTVFERLHYLPVELMWKMIRDSVYGEKPIKDSGKVISLEFWPHWNAKGVTNLEFAEPSIITNKRFVEPDVFIRFENFDLIVEAKRDEYNKQDSTQWKNEIYAYLNEYSKEQKDLVFLSLDGLNSKESSIVTLKNQESYVDNKKDYTIYKSRWFSILASLKDEKRERKKTSDKINSNDFIIQIIDELISVFKLYGFPTGDFLEVFPNTLQISKRSMNYLLKNKLN